MIDLLICDCDGVLVDSEVLADRILLATLQNAFPALDLEPAVRGGFGQKTSLLLEHIAQAFNLSMPADMMARIERAIEQELAQSLRPIAGARDALLSIALPAAVASNSRLARTLASVRCAGLSERFGDRVFSAEQVARPKPYPDVYLFAARTLGVDAARCLVVEDSIPGLTAARDAGMKTIAFVGGGHIPAGYAQVLRTMGITRIVERMEQLPALVEAAVNGDFGDVQS
jgi:HAD superfamily hydrolase (TIGR01509 family)